MSGLASQTLLRLWPVGLCWLLMMLGDVAVAYFFETGGPALHRAFNSAIGYFFGQLGLVAILGGLVGRTWITGWLLAVALSSITTVCCLLGSLLLRTGIVIERLALISLWPVLMLAVCGPFIAMRGLRGWSLTLGHQTAIVKQRFSLEDMFLLSVVVACSLSFMRVMSALEPGSGSTNELSFVVAVFFCFSLLFDLPATAITFRARNWWRRLAGWVGVALVVIAACAIMSWVAKSPSEPPWSELGDILVVVLSCSLTMAVGACAMLASGLRLTHFASSSADVRRESGEDQLLESRQTARRTSRWLTGGVVLATLLVGGWLSYEDHRQMQFFDAVQDWGKSGSRAGSSITIKGDTIVSLAVSPDTTDATFQRYTDLRELQRLSVAHSRITDDIVGKLAAFPRLEALDLSNTEFSDAGLERLSETIRLGELSIANTRVTPRKALEVAQSMHLAKLDVSELGITDEHLQVLRESSQLGSLALRGNPITDQGISQLVQPPIQISALDLSNTAINGSGLVAAGCPPNLILDGTKLTDANLSAILKANPGITVSVKNTAITAQALKVAGGTAASVALGGGQISDQDIANLGAVSFRGLRLNGPEFTGASLSHTQLNYTWLDLSGSGVTDASFSQITNPRGNYIMSLDLSHTQLSDAIFPALRTLQCFELDLRQTRITAAGLLNARLPCGRIIVGHDQFTPAELNNLSKNVRLFIDEDPMYQN